MFLDFALLTEQQGELLDQIEYQVRSAADYIEDANVDVHEAIEYQKKIRKKQWCVRWELLCALSALLGLVAFISTCTLRSNSYFSSYLPSSLQKNRNPNTAGSSSLSSFFSSLYCSRREFFRSRSRWGTRKKLPGLVVNLLLQNFCRSIDWALFFIGLGATCSSLAKKVIGVRCNVSNFYR